MWTDRQLVWIELSELFLDTESTDATRAHVARNLAQSPFTEAELDEIFHHEVCPVCTGNLLSVAGVWSGFKEDHLVDRIEHYLTRRRFRLPRALRLGHYLLREEWAQIRNLTAALRAQAHDPL